MGKLTALKTSITFFLLSPFCVLSNQAITGDIKENLNLFFTHTIQANASEYNSIMTQVPAIGITQTSPKFIGSPSNKVKVSGDNITIWLKKTHGMEDVQLSYEMSPVFHTPVFVGYDLTVLTGDAWLGHTNKISISYPNALNFISSKPVAVESSGKLDLNYPKNNYFGEIGINYISKEIPDGYSGEDVGIFSLLGKKEDVTILKMAVKDLEFVSEMFQRVIGQKIPIDRMYIIIDDLSGRGSLYQNAGGYLREPNIIMLDRGILENPYIPSLQKTIIHEMAHAVTLPLIFSGEQKFTAWLDEGIAVFFENYAANKYLGGADYFIEKDNEGNLLFRQDLDKQFTPSTLRTQYEKKFMFDVPGNQDEIEMFYTHAGLVFYSFYKKVGDEGMQKFFKEIGPLHSSGVCPDCDNKKVLKVMATIASSSQEEILYPYKNNLDKLAELHPIIKNDYTQEEINQILTAEENISKNNIYKMIGWFMLGGLIIITILVLIKKIRKEK